MEAVAIISNLRNKWEPAGDSNYRAIREYNDKLEAYHNMEKAIECPFQPPKCRTGDREKDIQLQREYEENSNDTDNLTADSYRAHSSITVQHSCMEQ